MPQYVWKEVITNQMVTVVRKITDSDIPPTEEEADWKFSEGGVKPSWQKQLQSTNFQRGGSWRGSKGNW